MAQYSVVYMVTTTTVGDQDAFVDALNGIDAKKITVTVTHDAMGSIDLVGYRTEY